MKDQKFAVILGVYGKPSDRFMAGGYKPAGLDVFERIKLASADPLVNGVELIEGSDGDINRKNSAAVFNAVRDASLAICAVNPDLWGEIQWTYGTLGAPDTAIRRQAISRIQGAMDLAAQVDCPYVGLWPGQDGYDYLFQTDYQKLYDWWVEGVQACADHNPDIKIGLEYKPYEPRTHSFLDTAAKTLLFIRDVNRPNVGLTFDVGHAMIIHENLGEVVALAQRDRKLFHLHLNDNFADWDWDMNFGSVHLYDFIEMLYWLKRTEFNGWYSVDIFAYRTEGAASVQESLAWLRAMLDFVDRTGMDHFDQLLAAKDPIAVSRFFRKALFPKALELEAG